MRIRSIRQRPVGARSGLDVASAPTTPSPALSEAEAARYIGMSPAWLKKSRTRRFRELTDAPPFVRSGGRRVVYRRVDLDAWQERHLEKVGRASDEAVLGMDTSA
ncbi:MAG: DNA-binding protein [Acidobacteria bacterium]|nr:DNA-binding protein [Acidobacteriota bacterium]